MRDIFVRELTRAADADADIILLTGDLGFGVLSGFSGAFEERFPDKFINAGVAEQAMSGVAAGLALSGHKVFTYSIANFPTLRCLEQIRNDICYHNLDVTIVSVGGGFSYGSLGASHHATEDLAILRALPNIRVLVPSDDWEAAEATKALLAGRGPAYLRLDKSSPGNTQRPGDSFSFGKARIIRDGDALTFIVSGGVLGEVLLAREELAQRNYICRVMTMPDLTDADVAAIEAAARETSGIITVEEHSVKGGLGGLVAETLLEHGTYPRRFRRLGLDSGFVSVVGDQQYLRGQIGLTKDTIVSVASRMLNGIRDVA